MDDLTNSFVALMAAMKFHTMSIYLLNLFRIRNLIESLVLVMPINGWGEILGPHRSWVRRTKFSVTHRKERPMISLENRAFLSAFLPSLSCKNSCFKISTNF